MQLYIGYVSTEQVCGLIKWGIVTIAILLEFVVVILTCTIGNKKGLAGPYFLYARTPYQKELTDWLKSVQSMHFCPSVKSNFLQV